MSSNFINIEINDINYRNKIIEEYGDYLNFYDHHLIATVSRNHLPCSRCRSKYRNSRPIGQLFVYQNIIAIHG
jgi:hypothetical protein